MSDFTTTLQDAYREFCIQAHGVGLAIRSRVADQQGQTAAEYMGILLVVAVIIGALLASHIDTRIAKAAGDMAASSPPAETCGTSVPLRAPEPAPRLRGAFASGSGSYP